jgi:RNA polymerase sigma factor (sigma-70 family)
MKHHEDELIPTRASLIHKLKNWQDSASWQDFFKVYWKLIYGVARKSGLTDDEAQDVVQETLISVAKHMPTFKYDPAIGSFKAWLLTMTRWRIIGQFRKRQPLALQNAGQTTVRTDAIDDLPDVNLKDMAEVWETEWQTNLLQAAKDNLRRKIDPMRWQIFEFYVSKEWPPEKVAQQFGVSADQVYQIKHRVTEALRVEVERLDKQVT